jgi:uncharacterized protein (TIGR02453 family)
MISENITGFLEALKENNNRDWFNANKDWYESVKKEFEAFAGKLILSFGKVDKEIAYLEPKNCTYRIYRDIRFSADKTPFKNNMGAYLVKGGKSSGLAGYYFHLEEGSNMIAGGLWMPMPDVLKKLRREIYDNTDEFLKIIENKNFKKHFSQLDSEMKLKNPPKDYPKDFEHIDLLKYKSYTVSKHVNEKQLQSPKLVDEIVEAFTAMMPFNRFLNTAIMNND